MISPAVNSGSILEVWNSDVRSSNITSPSLFPVGSQFAVRVNLTSPGSISGFDVTLNYNITSSKNILQAVKTGDELTGGLFDPTATPAGCFVIVARNQIDFPAGRIRFAAVMAGGCSAKGTGTLFTITFRVTGGGASFIDIVRTGSQGQTITKIAGAFPDFSAIPFQPVDARFQNVPGIPPVARFSYEPNFPTKGDNVSFVGVQSYDPDSPSAGQGGIRKYLWIFGDGTAQVQGANQTHQFVGLLFTPASGNFTATLMVWDADNNLPGRVVQILNISPGMLQLASYNWSGYAVSGSPGSVTDVKGSWTVPGIIGECGPTEQHSSFWVGIDGLTSPTVEQIGTDSGCMNGSPIYFAWYELYPQAAHLISRVVVQPGDIISAEVSYSPPGPINEHGDHGRHHENGTSTVQQNGSHEDGPSGGFTLSLINLTTGASFKKHADVPTAQLSSAEWVAEAPSGVNGTLPLANFGKGRFGQDLTGVSGTCYATVAGVVGSIGSFGSNVVRLIMVARGGYGVKAAPSRLSPDTTSFVVQWEFPGP
jgi:hypothetical protein